MDRLVGQCVRTVSACMRQPREETGRREEGKEGRKEGWLAGWLDACMDPGTAGEIADDGRGAEGKVRVGDGGRVAGAKEEGASRGGST